MSAALPTSSSYSWSLRTLQVITPSTTTRPNGETTNPTLLNASGLAPTAITLAIVAAGTRPSSLKRMSASV